MTGEKESQLKGGLLIWLAIVVSVSVAAAWLISGLFRRTETPIALQTAINLRNAIRAYESEYSKLPSFDSQYDTDLTTEVLLMDILLAADHTRKKKGTNPRGIQFFYAQEAKRSDDGTYRKGIQGLSLGRGELWDPWGNYYRVRLDTNHDEEVSDPSGRNEILKETILAWSAGPDGDYATWEDNVWSWQYPEEFEP